MARPYKKRRREIEMVAAKRIKRGFGPTKRQRDVLVAIKQLSEHGDAGPTNRAVAQIIGIAASTAHEHVHWLRAYGFVKPGQSKRSIKITRAGERFLAFTSCFKPKRGSKKAYVGITLPLLGEIS